MDNEEYEAGEEDAPNWEPPTLTEMRQSPFWAVFIHLSPREQMRLTGVSFTRQQIQYAELNIPHWRKGENPYEQISKVEPVKGVMHSPRPWPELELLRKKLMPDSS